MITSKATVRICDIGGWLDTWFAKSGEILNLGVYSRFFEHQGPYRGINVLLESKKGTGEIIVHSTDPSFDVQTNVDNISSNNFDHTNLLLATLFVSNIAKLKNKDINIWVMSPIPPGASMGTSAAVSVALLKALYRNKTSNEKIAQMALKAETEIMKRQSGTQDQFSAAYSSGVNRISVHKYPKTSLKVINISKKIRNYLDDGLITIFYGRHDSSTLHEEVIKGLKDNSLNNFRGLAEKAEEYLLGQDIKGFGKIMKQNTKVQKNLCTDLICDMADSIIELSKYHKAIGWKVNGAGGVGGSVTLLFGSKDASRKFFQKAKSVFRYSDLTFFEHKLA